MTAAPAATDRSLHPGELRLRRHRLKELSVDESASLDEHLLACAACRMKVRAIEEEESDFRSTISFDRFSAGVVRAHRVPRPSRRRLLGATTALAAAAAVLFLVLGGQRHQGNGIKGDRIAAELRVAGQKGQRVVVTDGAGTLQPGDRVRLGYRAPTETFLYAASIDDAGEVTALYPESGPAMRAQPSHELRYLPDSLEFTGSGQERVFLFLLPSAVGADTIKHAITDEFAKSGKDLVRFRIVPPLQAGTSTFTWLLSKP